MQPAARQALYLIPQIAESRCHQFLLYGERGYRVWLNDPIRASGQNLPERA